MYFAILVIGSNLIGIDAGTPCTCFTYFALQSRMMHIGDQKAKVISKVIRYKCTYPTPEFEAPSFAVLLFDLQRSFGEAIAR